MWTWRTVPISMFLVIFLFAADSARAETHGVGLRGGISADPEQVYFGAHVDVKEIVERFWFRPNAEFGFGDGVRTLAFNGEFVYMIRTKSKDWTPYAGGGPALMVRSFRAGPGGDRNTDTGPGFNFVGGVQQRKGFLAEIKIGALDSPSFKLGVGWTW